VIIFEKSWILQINFYAISVKRILNQTLVSLHRICAIKRNGDRIVERSLFLNFFQRSSAFPQRVVPTRDVSVSLSGRSAKKNPVHPTEFQKIL
jgi:hypothetical protein